MGGGRKIRKEEIERTIKKILRIFIIKIPIRISESKKSQLFIISK